MFANSASSAASPRSRRLDADLELGGGAAAESAATALADEEAARPPAAAMCARSRRAALRRRLLPTTRIRSFGSRRPARQRADEAVPADAEPRRADATAFYGGDYGFGGHRFKGEELPRSSETAPVNAAQNDAAALHAARWPALHSQRQKAAANNVRNTMRHLGENVPAAPRERDEEGGRARVFIKCELKLDLPAGTATPLRCGAGLSLLHTELTLGNFSQSSAAQFSPMLSLAVASPGVDINGPVRGGSAHACTAAATRSTTARRSPAPSRWTLPAPITVHSFRTSATATAVINGQTYSALVVTAVAPLLRAGRRDRAVGPDHVPPVPGPPPQPDGDRSGLRGGGAEGERTPRKGSAREVQGTAGLLR